MNIDITYEKLRLEREIRSYVTKKQPIPCKLLDQYSTLLSVSTNGIIIV